MNLSTTVTPPRAGRREWIALGVLALPALLVSIDMFVLLLAVPHISADLGASSTEQLWILDGYGLMLAGCMLTMGSLGDRIGRRRLLLIGAVAFAAASILAAFSVTPIMLIVARGLLGIAGATLAPSTLALISNLFHQPAQRAQAIGIWLVCFMGGAAVGPLVGGVMLEHFWWGAAFLLGVPAMALLLILGPILLPEHRDGGAARIDLRSVALSLAAMLPAVYGIKELARLGWRPVPVLAVIVGLTFAVTFVARQLRLADPLLDVRLFRNRTFATAVAGMHLITITGATMYFVTQHLQLVAGLSPLAAGTAMLPGVVGSIAGFLLAPLLARRIRPARLIAAGMAISTTGVLLIALDLTGPLLTVVVGYALFQLGCGPMVTLGTDLVVGSAPVERAGSAAATSEAASELGYALGIAILGSVAAVAYRYTMVVPPGLPAPADGAARDSLAGAIAAAQELDAASGAELLDAALLAAGTSTRLALVLIAAVLVAVAVLALTLLRHVAPSVPDAAAGEGGEPTFTTTQVAASSTTEVATASSTTEVATASSTTEVASAASTTEVASAAPTTTA